MKVGSLMRRLTGIGGEREFADVSQREGTTPLAREGTVPTVVAIHGFTGVPGEVQICCDVAEELGLAARAPLLAGHGSHAGQLGRTRFGDWVESARPTFDEVRRRGPVILVGLSLGSLIATELLLSAPGDVAGIVMMSNAFWLKRPHPGLSLAIARHLRAPAWYVDKDGPDLGDLDAYSRHVTYDAQPLHSAISLQEAGKRLREELFRVHRPTLLIHGARDSVCPVSNAWRVAQRLGTRDSKIAVLPRSKHIITRDVDKGLLRTELREFYSRVSVGARPWG